MENITFYEQINLFLENKRQKKPSACIHKSNACAHKHRLAHAAKVLETYERQVFCINVEVWNESHIV